MQPSDAEGGTAGRQEGWPDRPPSARERLMLADIAKNERLFREGMLKEVSGGWFLELLRFSHAHGLLRAQLETIGYSSPIFLAEAGRMTED